MTGTAREKNSNLVLLLPSFNTWMSWRSIEGRKSLIICSACHIFLSSSLSCVNGTEYRFLLRKLDAFSSENYANFPPNPFFQCAWRGEPELVTACTVPGDFGSAADGLTIKIDKAGNFSQRSPRLISHFARNFPLLQVARQPASTTWKPRCVGTFVPKILALSRF